MAGVLAMQSQPSLLEEKAIFPDLVLRLNMVSFLHPNRS